MSKLTPNRKIDYILDGKTILKEKITKYSTNLYSNDRLNNNETINSYEEEIEYIYSKSGVIGFRYNNEIYYYNKNILGDILEIYDSKYNLVGKYEYDAWGNHIIITNINNIANINPFRYRSYYYDIETNLYYLQSRYYDPQTHRFINMDSIEYLDPENINGLNLYAYCGNNPVVRVDYNGNAWWEWFLAGIVTVGLVVGAVLTGGTLIGAILTGAAIGASMSLGTQALSRELNWGQFILDIGVGAITGLIGGSAVSKSVATTLGGLIGAGSNLASQLIGGASIDDISIMQIMVSGMAGAISGFIGGAGARNKAAINQGQGVQNATSKLNRVLERIVKGTRFKSLSTAQIAFTKAMNGLYSAVQLQMSHMFKISMRSYAVSTAIFNGINIWFNKSGFWIF